MLTSCCCFWTELIGDKIIELFLFQIYQIFLDRTAAVTMVAMLKANSSFSHISRVSMRH